MFWLTGVALLNFFSVTSWTFYLLTVLGLLILRVKEPHLNRPYKAWIITPITFCIVSIIWSRPEDDSDISGGGVSAPHAHLCCTSRGLCSIW